MRLRHLITARVSACGLDARFALPNVRARQMDASIWRLQLVRILRGTNAGDLCSHVVQPGSLAGLCAVAQLDRSFDSAPPRGFPQTRQMCAAYPWLSERPMSYAGDASFKHPQHSRDRQRKQWGEAPRHADSGRPKEPTRERGLFCFF